MYRTGIYTRIVGTTVQSITPPSSRRTSYTIGARGNTISRNDRGLSVLGKHAAVSLVTRTLRLLLFRYVRVNDVSQGG